MNLSTTPYPTELIRDGPARRPDIGWPADSASRRASLVLFTSDQVDELQRRLQAETAEHEQTKISLRRTLYVLQTERDRFAREWAERERRWWRAQCEGRATDPNAPRP